ncbi:MAG: hypothetical protein GY849_16545 [Deltaproteobacteria bacterium]|nr:hypothetical protein [Deltaproteobacteria bacterium]
MKVWYADAGYARKSRRDAGAPSNKKRRPCTPSHWTTPGASGTENREIYRIPLE